MRCAWLLLLFAVDNVVDGDKWEMKQYDVMMKTTIYKKERCSCCFDVDDEPSLNRVYRL